MAVRLRLVRLGKKHQPFYRVVVANSTSPRNGASLEVLGTYDPTRPDVHLSLNEERVTYWLSVGAQPSVPVQRLFAKRGLVPAIVKIPKTPGFSKKEKRAQAA